MFEDKAVYIVDLNSMIDDDHTTIAMDFTAQHGPFVLSDDPKPVVGEVVTVRYDDDCVLYFAEVTRDLSARQLEVRLLWETGRPILNSDWHGPAGPAHPLVVASGLSDDPLTGQLAPSFGDPHLVAQVHGAA